MKVKLHYQIKEVDGPKIEEKYIETKYDDPIFLNMQFCMERQKFNDLDKLCKEWKYSGIHELIRELLDEVEPEKIIYFLEQQNSLG